MFLNVLYLCSTPLHVLEKYICMWEKIKDIGTYKVLLNEEKKEAVNTSQDFLRII